MLAKEKNAMKTNMLPILSVIVILTLLCSCSIKLSENGNIFPPYPAFKKISMLNYTIEITDKRQFIDDRKVKIATLLDMPGMIDRISPKIELDLKGLFSGILEQFKTRGDKDLLFSVEIIDIIQEFSADTYSETEYVSTRLKVTVKDRVTGKTLNSSEGEGWGSRKSTCAKAATIKKMLDNSIKSAFIDALNKLTMQ